MTSFLAIKRCRPGKFYQVFRGVRHCDTLCAPVAERCEPFPGAVAATVADVPSRVRIVTAWMACLTACLLAGCHPQAGDKAQSDAAAGAGVQSTELPVLKTRLVQVKQQRWPHIVRSQGSLVADDVSQIGATVAGRVAEVHVDLGDRVDAGDQLVTLDQEEFRIQVAQAEAALHEARAAVGLGPDTPLESLDPTQAPAVREAKTVWDEARLRLERARGLRAAMAISAEELDQIAAAEQVAAARYASALNAANERIQQIRVRTAELDLAKRRLKEAVTVAPFRGFVAQRHVAPGAYVQVGQPLVTLVRMDELRFRGSLPERYAAQLQLGQKVELSIEGFSEPVSSRITRISPQVDELTRAIAFEAVVPNSDYRYRAGLFAEARVYVDEQRTALVIPASAMWEFAGTEKVFLVVNRQAKEHQIVAGQKRGQLVEVLEGLKEGDWIVLDAATGHAGPVEPISTEPVATSGQPVRDEGSEATVTGG
ncbi:MAG: RND transporter [Pirellulaceae bacterium]|nr:MAG: RND transporter [Pirellulaceae bacterium]GIW96279.1 MAG: RND transporter [Pirellulaceae bacterium]